MSTFTLIEADCIEAMASMDEASVDAIVTDPPYGLEFMGKEWDKLGGRGVEPRPVERARFMQVWHEDWATQALRVLKPGGHLLAFGGTRTYHRLACALEDAGFEIRDTLCWLYGSGFPKSLDVSKAIDKARGDNPDWERVGIWLKTQREAAGHTRQSLAPMLSGHKNLDSAAANMSNWENGLSFPTWDRWEELRGLLGFGAEMDAEVWRLNGRKGAPGEAWGRREVIGEKDSGLDKGSGVTVDFSGSTGRNERGLIPVTAPALDEAERWQGWGTALKPAFEPIVLARKPLMGTVAQNVLEHGTGALNIDGTRIEAGERPVMVRTATIVPARSMSGKSTGATTSGEITTLGRWPANVLLDEDAAALLDEQSGERPSGSRKAGNYGGIGSGPLYGDGGVAPLAAIEANSGGASRFFYVPKADREERNRGLEGFEEQPTEVVGNAGTGGFPGRTMVDGEWVMTGTWTETGRRKERRNHHPTVKPVELMQWLVRLITPPKGTVLDPFAGSGSTGIAALREGFDFIGIEREADYVEIARARILGDAPLFNVETP